MSAEPDLDDLIGAIREGTATDEQMAALSQRLSEDPAARRYYAEQSYLNTILAREFSESAAPAALFDESIAPVAPAVARRRQPAPVLVFILGAAAAALLALALWPEAPVVPQEIAGPSDGTESLSTAVAGGTVRWTENAVWQFETDYSQGGQVPAGMALGLSRGRVLIEVSPNVQLLVSGTTKFEITSPERIRLFEGDLGLLVKGDDGIVCEVPGGEIHDIGTEFSLQVRGNTVLAHVFEGSIEAHLETGSTATATADQALRFNATTGQFLSTNEAPNPALRISEIAGSSISADYDYAESVIASGSTRVWSFADFNDSEDGQNPTRAPFRLRNKTWLKALSNGNTVLATYEDKEPVHAPLHASNLDEINGESFAIEFWFKQNTDERTRSTILAVTTAENPWRRHLTVQTLRTTPKTALRIAATYRQHAKDPGIQLVTPTTLPTELWHHLVLRRQDGELSLFINGELRAEHPLSDTGIKPASGPRKLLIGHMDDQGGQHQYWYNGYIDEIALYPNGLSDQAILEHVNKGAKLFPQRLNGTLFIPDDSSAADQ